jgi:hypothetical protein
MSPTCPTPRHHNYPPTTTVLSVSAFFLAFYPIFLVISGLYFQMNRRGSVLLRKRSGFLISVSCFGGFMTILAVALRDVIGPANFPCGLLYLFDLATLPLLMGPLIIRLARFKVEVALAKMARRKSLDHSPQHDSEHLLESNNPTGGTTTAAVAATAATVSPTITNTAQQHNDDALLQLGILKSFIAYCEYGIKSILKIKRSEELKRQSSRFIASNYFVLFWTALLLLPFAVALLVFGLIENFTCMGCELSQESDIFFLVALSVIFVVGVAHAFRMWQRTRDPLGLLPEFFLAWFFSIPFFMSGKVLHITDPNDLQFNFVIGSQTIQWQWLCCIAVIGVVFAQTWFAVLWANRSHVSTAVLSTSVFEKNERLRDIFANTTLLEALREHMINELSVENLEFLERVNEFKANYETDKDNRQKTARRIYDQFLSRQAFVPINISSVHSNSFAAAFSKGNVPVTIFDDAREEIVDLMISDILPRFAKSKTMKEYNSRKPRVTLVGGKRKKTTRGSDLVPATPKGGDATAAATTAAALAAGASISPKQKISNGSSNNTSTNTSPRVVIKKNVAQFLGEDDVESNGGRNSSRTESVTSPGLDGN